MRSLPSGSSPRVRQVACVLPAVLLWGTTASCGGNTDDPEDPTGSNSGAGISLAVSPGHVLHGNATTGETAVPEDTAPPYDGPLSATGTFEDGRTWWVVRSSTGAATVFGLPRDPESPTFDEGFPVVLGAQGGWRLRCTGDESTPKPFLPGDLAAIWAFPVGPGTCCAEVCADGESDFGGEAAQASIQETWRLVSGEVLPAEGEDLETLVGVPMAQERMLALMTSGAVNVGLRGLAREGEAWEGIRGIVLYEPPFLPAIISAALGSVHLDTNYDDDADGNGWGWDDCRNLRYAEGDCETGTCSLDLSQIAWDPDVTAEDFSGVWEDDTAWLDSSGALYLDGNGNGSLDLVSGHPDVDENGVLELDEDLVLQGTGQGDESGDHYWHAPAVLDAVEEAGWFDEDTWPDHLPTASEARDFWEVRDADAVLETLVDRNPEATWMVALAAADHGCSQTTRPHIVYLYERLRALGAPVQLAPSASSLAAFTTEDLGSYNPLPAGEAVSEGTVMDHVPPVEVVGSTVWAACLWDLHLALWGSGDTGDTAEGGR